jgi:FAD/FMN-containing dehydrogenase
VVDDPSTGPCFGYDPASTHSWLAHMTRDAAPTAECLRCGIRVPLATIRGRLTDRLRELDDPEPAAGCHVLATEYRVCALPLHHRSARYVSLYLRWRSGTGDDARYAICESALNDGSGVVWDEAGGEWVYEHGGNRHDPEFTARTRYSLFRALEIARRLAAVVECNGMTAADFLARDAARAAAEGGA